MSAWEPGDGWREVQYGAEAEGRESLHWKETGLVGGDDRLWVREDPVPPLPTEPHTVIEVTWRENAFNGVFTLHSDTLWYGRASIYYGHDLTKRITGFEVLAEPTPRVALYEEQQRVARDVLVKVLGWPDLSDAAVERIRAIGVPYGVTGVIP